MNKTLLDFSSLHPAQLIGKKKWHHHFKDADGILNDQTYNWQDTSVNNIIWDSAWGNLSPAIYAVSYGLGVEFCGSGQKTLGLLFTLGSIVVGIVDTMGLSLLQADSDGIKINQKFYFAPISKTINTALLNTAVYTVCLPAKLVAKIMVKKEFAHQNKLLKTNEGTQILINENKAKALQIQNKEAIKQAKKELKETKFQTKIFRKTSTINKENNKMDSELKKLNLEIETLRR